MFKVDLKENQLSKKGTTYNALEVSIVDNEGKTYKLGLVFLDNTKLDLIHIINKNKGVK